MTSIRFRNFLIPSLSAKSMHTVCPRIWGYLLPPSPFLFGRHIWNEAPLVGYYIRSPVCGLSRRFCGSNFAKPHHSPSVVQSPRFMSRPSSLDFLVQQCGRQRVAYVRSATRDSVGSCTLLCRLTERVWMRAQK